VISKGQQFRQALKEEKPLQMVGTINAYCAKLAERVGYRALYLSGGATAAASYAWPDLGITTVNDVLVDIERITQATELPLLVDADTGWGGAFSIARTVKSFIRAQAAGLHIEDQVQAKRCGHRPNKLLVSTEEMVDRIKAAVDARTDENFVIMARTDALASETLDSTLERAVRYVEAGADMIFAEAVTDLSTYKIFAQKTQVPILANITEFGKTPLFTIEALREAQVSIALYPLSAFRAMSKAALHVYASIRSHGSSLELLPEMQTRAELYDYLNYHQYEEKLDKLFEGGNLK
jgi:methylisocitrate lyase